MLEKLIENNQLAILYLSLLNTILLLLTLYYIQKKNIKKFTKTVQKRIKKIVKAIIFRLSKLVPKDRRTIIFGAGNGTLFTDNPKFLFLKALEDKDVNAVWITNNKTLYRRMKKEGYNCYMMFSPKGLLIQLRASTGVVSHSPFYDFAVGFVGGIKIINTWHGVGLKKVSYANKTSLNYRRYYHKKWHIRTLQRFIVRILTFRDYYMISTSPSVTSYYPETFLLPEEKILELGQARNDVFFDDSLDDKDFPDFIKNNKVITYMPTHRGNGKKRIKLNEILDFERLNEFCEQNGYLFLIKMHFYTNENDNKKYGNIINIGSMNIDPQTLLKYTDILITDYSSCYTDYLLLDRPVLYYCYDYDEYITSDREMYFEYEDVTPGPKCRTFDDLLESMQMFMEGKDEYKEERERVLNIFYSKENQGITADKQWQYIKKNIMKL